jgi:hypothetical protein
MAKKLLKFIIFLALIKHMTREDILEAKLSIIKEIASTIISTDNLDSIVNLILDLALEYTKAKSGSILLLDEKGNLIVKAARGIDSELIPTLRIKLGEDICGKVAMEKTSLLVKDIESDKRIRRKRADRYKTKSFICCPILMKDKLLGVVNISDKIDGSPFTEDEFDLINILATQAAIALEHARLMSELRLKALEMDEINKELINTDRVKTEFVARMSHELRTPLNSIKGAVYYLKEKEITSKVEQAEFIEIISEETNKMIRLLDELLNFPRLEEEILKKEALNLKDMLERAIATKIIQDILADKKVSIKLICPEYLPDIIGDKIRILQLFINLIDGSIKYTIPGDSIELKVTDTESTIEIELFVKGRTIPDDELPVIFNNPTLWHWPNVPQDNLKFYLTKKTLKLHKGNIHVYNTPEGFTIKLSFPKSLKELRNTKIDELMSLFLSFMAESMSLKKCSLMLSDELTGDLIIRSALGIDEEIIKRTRLKIGDKIAGWVAIEGKPLLIEDIEKDPRIGRKNKTQYNTKSLLCLPIVIRDKVIGVLNLNNKESREPFNKKDLYLAMIISERISQMIEKVQKGDLRDEEFKIITKAMESLLNAGRKYKKEKERLMDLVYRIMQYMGCEEDEIGLALYTSLLYDLGLTQTDENILMKSQQLSAFEHRIIKTHPFSGIGLINYIETNHIIKKAILHHHERYDGSGYPDGLKGEDIPFISRVLAVADTYIAMTTERPYRKAINSKEAIEQIKASAGTQFDPKVVDAFLEITRSYPSLRNFS